MIKQFDVDVPRTSKPREKGVTNDVCEFIASDAKTCEVDAERFKSVSSCRSTYGTTVSRLKLSDKVVVVMRKDRVFIIKKEV